MNMSGLLKNRGVFLKVSAAVVFLLFLWHSTGHAAQGWWVPKFTFIEPAKTAGEVSFTMQLFFLFTVLALAPSIVLMMTSFTRIIIVFSFLRHAMGTQQLPPNQIFIGLALFLTAMIMSPVWKDINTNAVLPYTKGEITMEQAFNEAQKPLRKFMFRQTRDKDIALFLEISKTPVPKTREGLSTSVLIPAFILSELRTGFVIGFILYVPFLIIDMVVASVLMSMGMMMLPPIMISLPFKLLLFVLVDGWNLLVRSLAGTF